MVSEAFRAELTRFYAARDYRPLWFGSARPVPRTAELIAVLGEAKREGLNPADYITVDLQQACGDPAPDPLSCELALSDSLLRYARDVGHGLLRAAELDPNWHIPQQPLVAEALLARVAETTDLTTLLHELPPPHHGYQKLRDALAGYRVWASSGQWFPVPAGPTLRQGERGARVLALRERLGGRDHQLLESADPALFDDRLEAAVRAFQFRHGLDVDGIVGRRTLAGLNVPPQERIAQLRTNLERWRWLPRELGDSHILVNLAGFDLTLVQPGRAPFRMRAINGRPDRTSPAFQSKVNRLVLNPDWTVPRRLAVEDMLPQLQRDPHALEAKGIEVLRREGGELVPVDPASVDWHRLHKDNFPYVLRQLPGPQNSLGRIKFVMPNAFDIFIHDTPAKGLFAKRVRTLSSGCVRVEQPLELASRLLADGREDPAGWLQGRIDVGDTENLPLASPVPVYLVYLTAWVDEAGNLQFRDDVYGRNVQMRDRFAFP